MLGRLMRRRGPAAARRLLEKGASLERRGRILEALEAYQAAVEAAPGHVPARLNAGAALEALGRTEDAAHAYEAAREREPGNPEAAFNLGRLAYLRGQLPRAQLLLADALRIRPDFPEAQVVLASVHEALGNAQEAIACLQAALRSRPGYAGALRNLGLLYVRLRQWAQAEVALREAIQADPDDADALCWRGKALHHLGRLAEAVACLREALRVRDESAEAHASLGAVLSDLGTLEEAGAHFSRAIELQPTLAEAHAGLGGVHASEKRMPEASACYRRALELDPRSLHARINLGNVLVGRGLRAEALECYDAALALDPESPEARWCRAMAAIPALPDSLEEAAASRLAFASELEALDRWFDAERAAQGYRVVGLRQPFWLAYQEERNTDLLRAHGRLCARLMQAWPGRPAAAVPGARATGRIRVGVVSQFFRNHSVWNAIVKGWFQRLDRERFELAGFSLGGGEDAETGLARASAARFEHGPRPLEQWVEAIRASRPDALIYPEIGMDRTTAKLASLRLAPLQLASWGHPETTGLPTIDGYLSAEALEPDGAQANYTEELVALPHLGCCFEAEREAPGARLEEFGLDHAVPLLVCPGTPFKYAPEHDRVLARIARELGECRFLFFSYWTRDLTDQLQRRLASAFAREGLEAGRHLRVLPWLTRPAFLGLMRHADVYLDTIGFSGFNTALQAVQSGLPVVTLEGRFLRGRLASGILRRLGLPELIAPDTERYAELAVRLCRDAEYRDALRRRMALARGLLFDDTVPIRALEALLASRAG
jgi:predicted O-linked N-acetylglucosamine transferase (SPINDLY family)